MSTKEEDNEEIWKERCLNCIRCNIKEDCGECATCKVGRICETRRCFTARRLYDEKVKKMAEENYRQIMAKTAAREAETAASGSIEPAVEPEKKKRGRKKGSTTNSSKKITERDYVPMRPTRQQSADMRRKRTQLSSQANKLPQQCLNPDCIYEARGDSKYCSDECGLTLARLRLTEILPVRCKEYFARPQNYKEEMEHKRELMEKEFDYMTSAETKMIRFLEKLHEYVEKQSKFYPEAVEDRDEDNMLEACIVCGSADIPARKYAKHIDLCWSRSEKTISFGNAEKSNDSFYCETHEARANTYCKRLKSLCPEHRRPGPEHCLRICGYPKKWEGVSGVSGELTKTLSEVIESEDPFGEEGCMTKKDSCSKHHKWIPSLRGSIELEQACMFQKSYEMVTEKQKLRNQEEWATNALAILLYREPDVPNPLEFRAFLDSMKSPYSKKTGASDEQKDLDSEMAETAEALIAFKAQELA